MLYYNEFKAQAEHYGGRIEDLSEASEDHVLEINLPSFHRDRISAILIKAINQTINEWEVKNTKTIADMLNLKDNAYENDVMQLLRKIEHDLRRYLNAELSKIKAKAEAREGAHGPPED